MKRTFIVTVALAAFLLSFARLVVKVLESGAFNDLAHLLPPALAGVAVIIAACLWALVVDSVWIVGLFGVRQNRRDWRAWAMLTAYALLSVGIQAIGITRELAWGLPPAALVLALVILDLDQQHQPATGSTPLPRGQRLGVVDTTEPDRTVEFPPSPSVVIENHVSTVSGARADADTAVSTVSADAEPTVATAQSTADTTAGTSTRALVTAVWQQREVEGGQHLSAAVLAQELSSQRGQHIPASTVRAELARLRTHHHEEG